MNHMNFQRDIATTMYKVDQADLAAAQQQDPAMVNEAQTLLPEATHPRPQVDIETSMVLPVDKAANEVALLKQIRGRRVAQNTGYIALHRRSQ